MQEKTSFMFLCFEKFLEKEVEEIGAVNMISFFLEIHSMRKAIHQT